MNQFKKIYWALRKMGPRVVGLRAGVALRCLLGTTRKQFAPRPWKSISLAEICLSGTPTESAEYTNFKREQSLPFFFPLGRPPQLPKWLMESPAQRQPEFAERLYLIAADRPVYCFQTPSPEPLDWNANPVLGTRCRGDQIWCDIPDFDPAQGDIRLMWDPARGAWAIDLARAYARGISPDAAQLYWHWVDSWMSACPPWQGPHWKCGQESFVRFLAVMIGFWSLSDDPRGTAPARWMQIARLAWVTGYRIEHHIDYAKSQKNNHALSEACGLMLIGHLFPEFRQAAEWFQKGRDIFSAELSRQMYSDGSYVQHSLNYHRVMLQTAVVAALVAKWHGQSLDGVVMQHITAAEEFLFQMLDPETGQVPLYGNNDGAWVLPMDECHFLDFRGAVQAAHFLATGRRRFSRGAWDEDLLWLFGQEALDAPQENLHEQCSTAFQDGGYFTLRDANSWGLIRCHTYRDRPGQYDPLHFDLWHQGQNVLRDCGTYQYFPPEGRPMEDYFQLIRSHNTVEIDHCSPVERISRFLYFPWPRATLRWFEAEGTGYRYFEGVSSDYDRRPWHVLHRRAIVGLDDDVWLIVDDLLGHGHHTATLRWHFSDVPISFDKSTQIAALKLETGDWCTWCGSERQWDRLEIICGQIEGTKIQGIASPYYGKRIAIPVMEGEITTNFPLRLLTIAAPGKICRWQSRGATAAGETYEIHANHRAWRVEATPLDRDSKRIIMQVTPMSAQVETSIDSFTPLISGAVGPTSGLK
jgi:hypothetical protein